MPWVPILPNPRIGSSLLLFGYPGATPDTTPISLSFWANLCEEIGQYESLTLWFSPLVFVEKIIAAFGFPKEDKRR